MIRSNDEEASQVASQIFAAHKDNLSGLPAAIRSQVLINEMKHHETKELVATYLDLYTHATDAAFKRQLAAALAYATDAENIQTLLATWKDKFVVKPQDLSAWYLQSSDTKQLKKLYGCGHVKTGIGLRQLLVVI